MQLSVHDHLRSVLGPDTPLEPLENFIFRRATPATRGLAEDLLDKLVSYLDAAGTRDYVSATQGTEHGDHNTEVNDRYLQVLGAAKRMDAALARESTLRIRVGDLRSIIHEEQMRGVPEFRVREATERFMAEMRQHLRRHVEQTRGSDAEARYVLEKSEEALGALEEEINKLVDESLWRLLQRI